MTYTIDKRAYYAMLRKQKKITLREVADYVGCSIAHISRWENDLNNMSDEKQQKYYQYIENTTK
jgi:transcriptional regulator with XRE-family HTH domain